MKAIVIFITIFLSTVNILTYAQIDKMREKMDDVMLEESDGLLTLRFYDAQTAKPVANADVIIDNIGEYTTNGIGIVRFPIPEKDGVYAVHVSCEEYIPVDFPIEVVLETLFYNRFSLSKKMPIGHLRIVLEWDKKPADLDVHFEKDGDYHISYRNMMVSDDGIARLDRDDRDGYGAETITVKRIDDRDSYRFYVHNYSHKDKSKSDKLSLSKASVKVYGDNKLLENFQIPVDTKGVYWQVFTIIDGQINSINSVSNNLSF